MKDSLLEAMNQIREKMSAENMRRLLHAAREVRPEVVHEAMEEAFRSQKEEFLKLRDEWIRKGYVDNIPLPKDRAFVICPVRGVNQEHVEHYVKYLENDWSVYWPPRDTDQEDDTGYRICQDNRRAMASAHMVFLIWDGKSQGCLFDLGMAFAMRKPITIVSLPQLPEGKSFQKMVYHWEKDGNKATGTIYRVTGSDPGSFSFLLAQNDEEAIAGHASNFEASFIDGAAAEEARVTRCYENVTLTINGIERDYHTFAFDPGDPEA